MGHELLEEYLESRDYEDVEVNSFSDEVGFIKIYFTHQYAGGKQYGDIKVSLFDINIFIYSKLKGNEEK